MKSPEKFYTYNNNAYSGFLMRETEMKKLAKIITRHQREIYEFMYQNIDELEVNNWTLAYPDKSQHTVRYYDPNENKIDRLKVFKQPNGEITYQPVVIIAENRDEATAKYIEWWESENENKK